MSGPTSRRALGADRLAEPVDAGRTGRESEFRELVYRHYRLVLWHLRRQGATFEQAEDLAQETFLAAFRAFPEFRGETSIERWLLRIAENLLRKSLRRAHTQKRRGREVSLDRQVDSERVIVEAGLVDSEGPLRAALDGERLAAVVAALDGLPDQMRRCAVLRLFQDLSYREIAAALRVSVDVVKVQLFRARKQLREELEHLEGLNL